VIHPSIGNLASAYQKSKLKRFSKGDNLMNYSVLRLMTKSLLIFVLIVFFNNSAIAGGSFTVKWGKDTAPEQQSVKKKHKKGGPPAHAPAHGYRAKHRYRYYADQKVYHDTDRGLYFYLKGDNWEVGAKLPSRLSAGLGEAVTLELDTGKPYVLNAEHIKKYPSKKPKGKKRKKWAKKK
jgi:hypothetical protein